MSSLSGICNSQNMQTIGLEALGVAGSIGLGAVAATLNAVPVATGAAFLGASYLTARLTHYTTSNVLNRFSFNLEDPGKLIQILVSIGLGFVASYYGLSGTSYAIPFLSTLGLVHSATIIAVVGALTTAGLILAAGKLGIIELDLNPRTVVVGDPSTY